MVGPEMICYYSRTLGGRDTGVQFVVYVVGPVVGERPDPVPVIAGFPPGWRPTELPGQCLAEERSGPAISETLVPRSQFRHYQRVTREEALKLYPALLEQQMQRAKYVPTDPAGTRDVDPL